MRKLPYLLLLITMFCGLTSAGEKMAAENSLQDYDPSLITLYFRNDLIRGSAKIKIEYRWQDPFGVIKTDEIILEGRDKVKKQLRILADPKPQINVFRVTEYATGVVYADLACSPTFEVKRAPPPIKPQRIVQPIKTNIQEAENKKQLQGKKILYAKENAFNIFLVKNVAIGAVIYGCVVESADKK